MVSGTFSATPEKITVKAALYRVGKNESLGEWTLEAAPIGSSNSNRQLSAKIVQALGIDKPVAPAAAQGCGLGLHRRSPSWL